MSFDDHIPPPFSHSHRQPPCLQTTRPPTGQNHPTSPPSSPPLLLSHQLLITSLITSRSTSNTLNINTNTKVHHITKHNPQFRLTPITSRSLISSNRIIHLDPSLDPSLTTISRTHSQLATVTAIRPLLAHLTRTQVLARSSPKNSLLTFHQAKAPYHLRSLAHTLFIREATIRTRRNHNRNTTRRTPTRPILHTLAVHQVATRLPSLTRRKDQPT